MECNKEEALRAKVIAETKLQINDYSGAKKVALKAQKLYPDLENISQLILVCDVLLSAERKAYGNEKDWYNILDIDSTADEASIKKQYRKFALLLHPDKNRFAGACDAFKLIGEAHRILLDPAKRHSHDMKIKSVRNSSRVPNKDPNPGTQPWAKNSTSFNNFATKQQQNPVMPNIQATFWTMCPSCAVKYEYYRDVVNKVFQCHCCQKTFIGYEIKDQATSNTPGFQSNNGASKQNGGERKGSQGNVKFQPRKEPGVKKGTNEISGDSNAVPESSAKVSNKRKKQFKKSSVKSASGSKTNVSFEKNDLGGPSKKKKTNGSEKETRSAPVGEDVSFEKKDLGSPSKKKKPNTSEKETRSTPVRVDDLNKTKPVQAENRNDRNDGSTSMENGETISSEAGGDGFPDVYEFPDPDFNDFDKNRNDECFEVGQVWALYDPLDAMPRFYARITKIISLSDFKIKMKWLEADPDDEDEIKWAEAELPVSCGKFRTGTIDTTDGRSMFSHRVDWEKGRKRDTYKIYPQKGETWAIFKSWNMNWHSDSETKRKYEFEFVETLSDYCEENGVSVAYLGKVKGFRCLFCRTTREGADSLQIPRIEMYRFSHRVPSFHLSGEERDDVPRNSFELDPVSFPINLVEIDNPKDPKIEVETVETREDDSPLCEEEKIIETDSKETDDPFEDNSPLCEEEKIIETDSKETDDPFEDNSPLCEEEKKIETDSEETDNPCEEVGEASEIPEQEFFDFDSEKSPEKFQQGQCWALYSDEDGLPKYYAFIKNVVLQPKIKINITWLSASPSKDTIEYADKSIPVACGIFRRSKSNPSSYTDTSTFSHLIQVELTKKKDIYAIYPRKAEVWAVYKNWKDRMTFADFEKSEYDIVEVLEEKDFAFKVIRLEMVSGHMSVFKPLGKNDWIFRPQLLRFSHQIPAFKLTDQKGGNLRGYWELDLAAFPIGKFRTGDEG